LTNFHKIYIFQSEITNRQSIIKLGGGEDTSSLFKKKLGVRERTFVKYKAKNKDLTSKRSNI